MLAICERQGSAGVWHRTVGAAARRGRRGARAARTAAARARSATRSTRNLAYGKQRLVEIALALATQPAILLLDEPAAGIPAGESAELFGVIAELPRDVTDRVHRARHGSRVPLCRAHHRAWSAGKVLTEGTPAEIAADTRVKEVYLGEAQHG